MSPPLAHFYHAAVAYPRWQVIAAAHADAVAASGLDVPLTVGLIGSADQRQEAREWFTANFANLAGFTERDVGWEHLTLKAAWRWAQDNPGGAVLYCHAKGSYNVSSFSDAWRECMTRVVVGRWRECTAALRHFEYDVAGAHWLTPETAGIAEGGPFFGGNFWWANADYLSSLELPANMENRYAAEGWIGSGAPRAYDPDPGFPGQNHCMAWSPVLPAGAT